MEQNLLTNSFVFKGLQRERDQRSESAYCQVSFKSIFPSKTEKDIKKILIFFFFWLKLKISLLYEKILTESKNSFPPAEQQLWFAWLS